MSGHDSRVSRLEGFYPDGAAREPCPSCTGTGTAPSEADAVHQLVAHFAKAAEEAGFDEPAPEPVPVVDEEPPSPCGLCRGELFVTARAIEGHHAEVAESTAVTMQRLEATAEGLRRCDARWQRPVESMSFAEQLMSWWNRCEDATTESPGEPSSSGAATSAGPELVPPAPPLGRAGRERLRVLPGKNADHDKGA